jgi:Type I restriction enzyme R protein N terminus (HSDR_N)
MFEGFDTKLFESPDFKEDSVREEIIVPILRRLGYSASGEHSIVRSKSLVHPYVFIGTTKHPVSVVPDYTLLHLGKPILILDAKRPTVDVLDKASVQQAYSYAIHPEIKCRHFALCNGRQLAVFDVEEVKPVLVLPFAEFNSRWEEIERHVSPRYLLEPRLRRFAPDLGKKFLMLGMRKETEITMLSVRFGIVAKVSEQLYTLSAVCDFGGEDHFVSLDFSPEHLPSILSSLPDSLRSEFVGALSSSPFQASADLHIEIDVLTYLGEETQGVSEKFIPLVIHQVFGSRFLPVLIPEPAEPPDFPDHVFRLKKAFKVKRGGAEDLMP